MHLNAFGDIYLKQTLASGVIPQITAVFGTCGGGMAIVPALTDFTFIEAKNGKMFVNSPNALDGNYTEKCDTASAAFQSEETGLIDVYRIRRRNPCTDPSACIGLLPANFEDNDSFVECTDDLNRTCDDIAACAGDTSIALSRIADNGIFFETKRDLRQRRCYRIPSSERSRLLVQ